MTLRQRLLVIGFLFLVAPISAEFSSGYLQSTGDPAGLLMQFVIFAPFYGGAAVLIREAAVRARLSRSGLLVLATAVGLAHASLIDRSIFTLTGTEVAFWPEIMAPTWLAGPGFAAGPAVGWSLGHAIFSFGAPAILLDRLAPATRDRSALGIPGLVIVGALYLVLCFAVHNEVGRTYRPAPTAIQYAAAALVVLALAAVAFGPLGRRGITGSPGAPPGEITRLRSLAGTAIALLLGGAVCFFVDSAYLGWGWLVACLAVVAGVAVAITIWPRWQPWADRHAAAVMVGALVTRAITAFQTPPAEGVSTSAATVHHVAFLVFAVALGALALRPGRPPAQGTDDQGSISPTRIA